MIATQSVAAAVDDARRALAALGIDDARLEAEVLVAHALGIDRSQALARLADPLSGDVARRLATMLERRLGREPLAYIVGAREFYGVAIECAPGALIPRPETELLVDAALTEVRRHPAPLRIADVGTGTGAVAVAVALRAASARVTAVDISPDALAIAQRNVERHGLLGRVNVVRGDVLTGLAEFDAILANLPYVRTDDWCALPPEIRDHEPRMALAGGADGTDVIRRLLEQAPAHLAPGGVLALEMAPEQAPALREAARDRFPAAEIGTMTDLAGRARVLVVGTHQR